MLLDTGLLKLTTLNKAELRNTDTLLSLSSSGGWSAAYNKLPVMELFTIGIIYKQQENEPINAV